MTDTNNQNKTNIQTPAKDNQNPGQAASEKDRDQTRSNSNVKTDDKKKDDNADDANNA